MSPFHVRDGSSGVATGPKLSGAGLFKLLWDALVDLLGTAATAAILGRASRRAQRRAPELALLTFARVDGEFIYRVPPAFERLDGPPAALRALLDDLRPLLVELTGPVALRRLAVVPQLATWAAVDA
jgi:hypothetical protein